MTCRVVFMLVLSGLATPVLAAGPPTVERVAAPVGQRGTEFTIRLIGARLGEPRELLFYDPGLTCLALTGSDNAIVATLRAAADCRLGEHPFRVRTDSGISELRTVSITPLPVVREDATSRDGKGQPVPLNCTVVGRLDPADTDAYAVTLKQGQRLSVEVVGVRLGGPDLVDTVLTVTGPDGRDLATADDNPLFHQDPFASLIAPVDGVYTVRVRETSYGGGDGHDYALHIGTFVRPAAVFPAGGPAGTECPITLLGDPSGPIPQSVRLPQSGDAFALYPADSGGMAPTPNPFRVSPFPNVIEGQSGVADWPVAFNGVLATPGEVDDYRFRARRGDQIQVEAFASRVGSPLDSVVAVLDSQGNVLAAGDDDISHDSCFRVSIPADGEYVVRVTDKRGQGGPAFLYRVELDQVRSDLTVFWPSPVRKSQDRQVLVVPRGNRVTAFLAVRRRGVDGPVSLDAKGWPAGVTLAAPPIPADQYSVPVVVTAAADAPLGGQLVEVIGTSGGMTGGFEQVVDLVPGVGDTAYHSVRVRRLAMAVVEAAPLTVDLIPPATPLAMGGKLDVTVQVTRAAGFEGPVEVSLPFLPPGVEAEPSVTIPDGETTGTVTLSAQADIAPGGWQLVAQAKPSASPGRSSSRRRSARASDDAPPVASALVPLAISPAPVQGTFVATAAHPGATVPVVCRLDSSSPLANATAVLEGLPPRASAKPVSVRPEDRQIVFEVQLDATTPPGDYASLVCRLDGTVHGQRVVYQLGRSGSLRVEEPGGAKTDAAGKPLSPLDALRQKSKAK